MRALGIILASIFCWGVQGDPLDEVFNAQKWDATAQLSYDTLRREPGQVEAALKGAFALFQKGYPNAALVLLRRVPADQWDRLPPRLKPFADVIAILQKKIPLTVLPGAAKRLRESDVPLYLRDELLYAKGREAFSKNDAKTARHYFKQIGTRSRYSAEAHYLLAVLAIREGDTARAKRAVAGMFENTLFEQSSEFWDNVSAQMSQVYGSSVRVSIGSELLDKATTLGDLGKMALARIAYADKEFDRALSHYQDLPDSSPLASRARLETLWTLLQQNRHDEAQERAQDLSADPSRFESVEAKIVRAVILADAKRLKDARQELDSFSAQHKKLIIALEKYTKYGVSNALPPFIQRELASEVRLKRLADYQKGLAQEVAGLRGEDSRIFSVYRALAAGLRELQSETKERAGRIRRAIITQRLGDLQALLVQSKLIRVETYLEERDALREKFQNLKGQVTEASQAQHDRELVGLLQKAVDQVDEVLPLLKQRNPYLEFRHSEILWELGTARLILAQTEDRTGNEARGDRARKRSLKFAESVVGAFPKFSKRAQAMFFVGFAQIELDQGAKGFATLKRYTEQYALHQHVPDAYRILADHEFDNNRFEPALGHFLRILPFKDSPVIGYAFYKIAWCYYNNRKYGKAMLALEKAIGWANQSKNEGQLLSLKKEARRDLIAIYAEFGDPKRALEYVESFIGGETQSWMEELAARYDEAGQYESSNYIFNVLISMKGQSAKNLAYYSKILEGSFRLQDWATVLKVAQEMVDLYGPELGKGPAAKDSPQALAEEAMRKVALGQHFEFGKDAAPEVIQRIVALDRIYMNAYSGWPSAQPLFYKHAFYLSGKQRNQEAALTFKKHWEAFGEGLEEPLREESLRNLVNSLAKVDEKVGKKDGEEKEKGEAPLAVNPTAEDILKYAALYFKNYPKSKHARTLSFLRAATLLKYGKTDAGIEATQALFDADPKDKFGKRAFNNLSVAYYDTKDWPRVYAWAKDLLARQDGRLRQYEGKLALVREEALFLWASETKDKTKAAELFLKVVQDPASNRLKEKSLYNAVLKFQDMDDRLQVIRLSQELEKAFPKSAYLPQLLGMQAALYQEAGAYQTALPLLIRFLKTAKDIAPEVRAQGVLNAALLTQGMGRDSAAKALFHQFLSLNQGKAPALEKQAKAALKVLNRQPDRSLASTPKNWSRLGSLKADFLKTPVPKKGALAARIKQGAKRLENTAKQFLKIANDTSASNYSAFEAYCATPLFYRAYAIGVMDLVFEVPEAARGDVRVQLSKVTEPLIQKANSLAGECLEKSRTAYHDGPWFREVNQSWGWESDTKVAGEVEGVIRELRSRRPWVAPSTEPQEEKVLIERHLKKEGTPETWYALALSRFKQPALARLTLIDALAKSGEDSATPTEEVPFSRRGRVLNALAALEWNGAPRSPKSVESLFLRAQEAGSVYAHANLALFHLQAGRLELGRESLEAGAKAKVFDALPSVLKFVQEGLQK